MDIAYVGNTGVHLDGTLNENAPTPGGNTSGGCPTVGGNVTSLIAQCRAPFDPALPFYSKIILDSGFGFANYNALQVSVTHRLSHGLQITPAFTWQHTLTDGTVENPTRPQLSWGSTGNPLDFTITGTYYLPNHKAPAQLLSGWEVNTTVYMLSGGATTATDGADDLSGTGQGQDHWNILGTPRAFKLGSVGHPVPCYGIAGSSFARTSNCQTVSTPTGCTTITTANAAGCIQGMPSICVNGAAAAAVNANVVAANGQTAVYELAKIGCYVAGNGGLASPSAALFPQSPGTFGTEGQGTLYGHGFRNMDFSVLKNFKFKERYGVQFRAEFFNLFNRTLIYGAGGTALNTPATFGQIVSTPDSTNPVIGNGARKIQFGLKLSF
jgi:hypothetical protein